MPATSAQDGSAAKPNFVVLFADDLGYQDLGCFGSPDIRTPRIDQMAKEGMCFTSFYAQPVWGPSRAALLTGCYLAHTMPHTKLAASKDFLGRSARGLYGDVVEEIDFNTGRLLDTLKSLGIDENTYVIFTSDNGPWWIKRKDGGSASPLRFPCGGDTVSPAGRGKPTDLPRQSS